MSAETLKRGGIEERKNGESNGSAVKVVGATGFEPATSTPPV